MTTTPASSPHQAPLAKDLHAALVALIDRDGPKKVARDLGIPLRTLTSAVARMPLRRGTHAMFREALRVARPAA